VALVAAGLVLAASAGACSGPPPREPVDLDTLASYPPTTALDSPVTLVGAGDIGRCDRDADEATAALLEASGGFVFTAGDNAYGSGSAVDFEACYDPGWGRVLDRTFPAPGNHDWETAGAAGYFDYFGDRAGDRRAGWYATTLGVWRLIVLASDCERVGGCGPESDQGRWLARELARNRSECTLAIWHHPLFSTGEHGPTAVVRPLWDQLHAAGVEVVVNGHEHSYERFRPLDPEGRPDPAGGIRQFVVGTGGADLRGFDLEDPNSEVRDGSTHGVLELTLDVGRFAWRFVPVTEGGFADEGSGTCH
jgi:alkaline phosphatase